jgi:hypothetical protein
MEFIFFGLSFYLFCFVFFLVGCFILGFFFPLRVKFFDVVNLGTFFRPKETCYSQNY